MAADLKEHYEQNLEAFQFIQDVPTDWQQSIALDGEVGEFVVFARQQRDAKDWFLGAITNAQSRQIELPLSFLEKGQSNEAQIYQDGKGANWQTNPYAIDIQSKTVTSEDWLDLNMATSGGTAIRFKAL